MMKRAITKQDKEERRAIILKAALNEFYEKGFAGALTEDIAERAGVSKGTVYLYFRSKEALFVALIDSMARPNLATLEMISSQAPNLETALDGLAKFAPIFIGKSDMPRLMKVLIGESQNFPELIKSYRSDIIDKVLGVITQMLSRANDSGEIHIEDPALTARLVVAPMIMSGLWQAVFVLEDDKPIDLEALFKIHIGFLLKAMKPGDAK